MKNGRNGRIKIKYWIKIQKIKIGITTLYKN
jgi:hypothetical protein